ncbi:MAG: pyridoxal phosphate-dependent aminotransferase [Bacteroidetes bacterium]|nr:pyridoxal phosphate-dependent aminotransferase [Bacteroidota bacterium]
MNTSEFKTKDTPVDYNIVESKIKESGISGIGRATIRELVKLVNEIEKDSGKKFIRMEMGVPGIETSRIGLDAEIESLHKGVSSKYVLIDGIPELKKEASRFAKLFMNIDVNAECCVPTVGSMQGSFAAFMLLSKYMKGKDTTLFIDPGFPVQKQQHHALGIKYEAFDVYDYRGEKLKDKIESYLKKGNISSIVYSNPNNPSWICLTEAELKIIGDLANQYDVIVVEDLAYFAMDFRSDLSKPGVPPYQPTVARYTDNYFLMVSSSKIFSYAGQRIAMAILSNKLFHRRFPGLAENYRTEFFGYTLIYRILYSLTAGTSHSAQYGLTAMLKAVNDGIYNFVEATREYGEKARIMKKLFTDNGFQIVYDKDIDKPLADGFYFTFAYPGFTGEQLLERMLYYGISAIALSITGSERTEGLRACVSLVMRNQFPELEARLKKFHEHYK